jgi:hypothetical protein
VVEDHAPEQFRRVLCIRVAFSHPGSTQQQGQCRIAHLRLLPGGSGRTQCGAGRDAVDTLVAPAVEAPNGNRVQRIGQREDLRFGDLDARFRRERHRCMLYQR